MHIFICTYPPPSNNNPQPNTLDTEQVHVPLKQKFFDSFFLSEKMLSFYHHLCCLTAHITDTIQLLRSPNRYRYTDIDVDR